MLSILKKSTTQLNSLVFVLKKTGQCRMVADLRTVNMVIQPMGSLQHGIPLPSVLSKRWPLVVIHLKDCLFIIPLQEEDRKFAFRVHTFKNSQPAKRYEWKVLPQQCRIAMPCANICTISTGNDTQAIS